MKISKKTHFIILTLMALAAIIISLSFHYTYKNLGAKAVNEFKPRIVSPLSCGESYDCYGEDVCCKAFLKSSCMSKEACGTSQPKPPSDWCYDMCIDQCRDSIWPAYCESACNAGCKWDGNPN
jgi:hypothetical protein